MSSSRFNGFDMSSVENPPLRRRYSTVTNASVCGARVLVASDPQDASLWDEFVDLAPIPDVYYRARYALASEAAGHGKAIALILSANNVSVLLPLLLRPLSDLPFAPGESGFDAITPYGYGGLLPLSRRKALTKLDVATLLEVLQHWCREAGIVSCFIRLHPLLDQESWLYHDQLSQYASLLQFRALTIAVDLTKWDSTRQRPAGLRRDRRLDLNHAQRCLRVSWSGSDIPLFEALVLFKRIYEQRMVSLNVSSYYFFPLEYYLSLGRGLERNVAVALAWLDRTIVGGSLFMADRQFAHYHLSGSNEQGRGLGAGTLLINAGAQWARERGCKLLHLGGGVSNSDSLFEYKKSFGGIVYRYHTLEVISDASRYHDLVERRFKCEPGSQIHSRFFPQYRA
jgi:GNAT superfamily N-acetyltransferase